MKKLRIYTFLLWTFLASHIQAQQQKLIFPIGHMDDVKTAEFSPDGKWVLTSSWDNTTKLWDAVNGNLISNFIDEASNEGAKFSCDGSKIVTFGNHSTKIWDTKSSKLFLDLKDSNSYCVDAKFFVNQHMIICFYSNNTIKVWNDKNGKNVLKLNGLTKIDAVTFSDNGKLAASCSSDSCVKIWNLSDGKILSNIKDSAPIISICISADGKKLATSNKDGKIKIWDLSSGKLVCSVGLKNKISLLKFLPDNKRALINFEDSSIYIYDVFNNKYIHSLNAGINHITTIDVSADYKYILCGFKNYIKIWNINSGSLLNTLSENKSNFKYAKFSIVGNKIVTINFANKVNIWDFSQGRKLIELSGHTRFCKTVQFSSTPNKVISNYDDNNIKVWDLLTNKILLNLYHKEIRFVKSSTNENNILIISNKGDIEIINYISGQSILRILGNKIINAANFSHDGKKIIIGFEDSTVKIWDLSLKILIQNFKQPHRVVSAEFSPDDRTILTLGYEPNSQEEFSTWNICGVYLWNASNGNLLAKFSDNNFRGYYASFSPNGNYIVTVNSNLDAIVWNTKDYSTISKIKLLENPKIIQSHYPDGTVKKRLEHLNFLTFSPDSKLLFSTTEESNVRIWDVMKGSCIGELNDTGSNQIEFSKDGYKVLTSNYKTMTIWDAITYKSLNTINGHADIIFDASFSPYADNIISTSIDNTIKIWNSKNGELLYTLLNIDSTDYLVIDKDYHYDGTDAARKLLYFTCGTEVIGLDQVKDQLWVPNLAERIMKGETINAPKLSDLDICNLTPQVEEIESKTANNEYHFKIIPRRGGLGETVLYVNDIEVKRYKPLQLIKSGSNYDLTLSPKELQQYFVPGQQNSVTVKSFTAKNDIASRGAKVTNTDTSKINSTPPNLYAVMVGVSDYKGGDLNLKYAAKDATDLSAAIGSSARKLLNGDGKEHVFTYNLTTNKDHYLLPEKKAIQQTLTEIGKKSAPNDILLVFFAGHGVTQGEKKKFYFLTSDASSVSATDAPETVGISTTELTDWIQPSKIKAQKRILILDACNSGQAIKDMVNIGQKDQNYVAARNDDKAEQIKAIDKLNERSGMFIMAASASNQSAYEMGRYNQGLLTYALLKVMKEQPDVLEDGKYLNVSRWFDAAEKTVMDIMKESGNRQQPQRITTTNFNIGIVDNDVIANIKLPTEKAIFTASNYQNIDVAIADDDLEMSKFINQSMNEISSRGMESNISYVTASNSPDAYTLTGRYEINGERITVNSNLKQNKEIKYKFSSVGDKNNLKELSDKIINEASAWLNQNSK